MSDSGEYSGCEEAQAVPHEEGCQDVQWLPLFYDVEQHSLWAQCQVYRLKSKRPSVFDPGCFGATVRVAKGDVSQRGIREVGLH